MAAAAKPEAEIDAPAPAGADRIDLRRGFEETGVGAVLDDLDRSHHIDFPDYTEEELVLIAERMLAAQNYRFSPAARDAFRPTSRPGKGSLTSPTPAPSATPLTGRGCARRAGTSTSAARRSPWRS